jgi:hypothetical protein
MYMASEYDVKTFMDAARPQREAWSAPAPSIGKSIQAQ